jgi:hypothetical protein
MTKAERPPSTSTTIPLGLLPHQKCERECLSLRSSDSDLGRAEPPQWKRPLLWRGLLLTLRLRCWAVAS